ncbi:MAG: hypothetical protein J4G03_04060 [Gemmatimonadetes bacterium]|nr:hypothetical protein [Gemmatimonadota bacterium]
MTVFPFVIAIVAIATLGKIVSQFIKMQNARTRVMGSVDPAELAALKTQVVDLSDEVRRLTEEQRFTLNLLEERSQASGEDARLSGRPGRPGTIARNDENGW